MRNISLTDVKIDNMDSYSIFCTPENGLYVQFPSDILSFKFNYNVNNFSKRIESFDFGRQEKTLSIVQLEEANDDPTTFEERARYINKVFSLSVANKKMVRIYIGEWYLECYIIGCGKNDLDFRVNKAKYDFTIAIEDPFWKRDTEYVAETTGKKYVRVWEGIFGADFKLSINGATNDAFANVYENNNDVNPSFVYGADLSLEQGQSLVIDTLNEEIYTLSGTTKTNVFDKRYTDDLNDIYARLPFGSWYFGLKEGDSVVITERAAQMPWWESVREVEE